MSKQPHQDETVIQIRTSTLVKALTPCVLVFLGATGYGTQLVRHEVTRNQPVDGFASKADVQALSKEMSRLNNTVLALTTRIDRLNDHN